MAKEKNIIVTGGSGFIGSHLVDFHLNKGDNVWVIDNLQSGKSENLDSAKKFKNFKFDNVDLITWDKLKDAVKWADSIYHLAATVGQYKVLNDPVNTLWNNIQTCQLILHAISSSKSKAKLLIMSTSEVYSHYEYLAERGFSEELVVGIQTKDFFQESYRASKMINELMGLSYGVQKRIDCTIVRLFNTIGTRQSSKYGMVVPNFIEACMEGKPLFVHGDGMQTRAFCNVKDVIRGLDLIMENPETCGEIYNLGSDEECTILDLAVMIKKLTNSDSEIKFISYEEAYGMEFYGLKRRKPNLEKIFNLTGYKPTITLNETIQEIIDYIKNKKTRAH